MNQHLDAHSTNATATASGITSSTLALPRWLLSSATLVVPQAAGPIAFALLALSATGDAGRGAALMLAMTIAQVAGAIPITRLGARFSAVYYLKALVCFRTFALASIAFSAWYGVPFGWLVIQAALAGMVNGAAHGYLRVVLNDLVESQRLPRSLGMAATLNEVTFVLAPVLASGLGLISPVFCLLAITVLGALPALLVPAVDNGRLAHAVPTQGRTLSKPILLWLLCATAGSSTVAAIEIGAVALALRFGYSPGVAILFTVPLCVASVAGGVWVSIRNRPFSKGAVLAQLLTMTLGSILAALEISPASTVIGAVLIGGVLAPLGTHYSLTLDGLAPAHKRAEVFALLRTATAIGIIVASTVLTLASLSTSLKVVAAFMLLVTAVIALSFTRRTLQ